MPAKRKTIAELKASGSYRPGRYRARELAECPAPVVAVQPAAGTRALPADVAEVRAELAALLGSRVTPADALQLTELAERVVEVRRLREVARVLPVGSVEAARLARVLAAATTALDRLSVQFGLTPAARGSLPEAPPETGVKRW